MLIFAPLALPFLKDPVSRLDTRTSAGTLPPVFNIEVDPVMGTMFTAPRVKPRPVR